jgi:hypothetical protein
MVYTMHHLDHALAALETAALRNRSVASSAASPAFRAMLKRHQRFARDVMPFMHAVAVHARDEYARVENSTGWVPSDIAVEHVLSHHHGRALLELGDPDANSTDWKQNLAYIPLSDAIGDIQAYSSLIAAGVSNPLLPEELASRWLEGPLLWPPVDRTLLDATCPAATTTGNIIVRGFTALGNHLVNIRPVLQYEHHRIQDTFPRLHMYNGSLDRAYYTLDPTERGSIATTFLGILESFVVDILQIDYRFIVGFATGPEDPEDGGYTASRMVRELLTCDFENILDCNRKRTNTFVGAVAVVVVMASLYLAFGSITAFVLGGVSVPLLILWWVVCPCRTFFVLKPADLTKKKVRYKPP